MKTIEELAELMEQVTPTLKSAQSVMGMVPATVRPFFHRALTGYAEQTTALFDRHLALCNALEFTLTLRRALDNPEQWMDQDGKIWEPDPDTAFLLTETQARMARAKKATS